MGVRVEGSSPRLSLGLVLRHAPALLLWGHPRVASGLPCERLDDLEWVMGYALLPARAALREAGLLGDCHVCGCALLVVVALSQRHGFRFLQRF